jgi:hypothetical protein
MVGGYFALAAVKGIERSTHTIQYVSPESVGQSDKELSDKFFSDPVGKPDPIDQEFDNL